ncbi:hypothetical protein CcaverHIS641_0508590 [Cutaneotrichosporon cavernicola]|nr:hypothetical protein CcaverHIS641_0508590 [Cutaneotrichosporon cavernicola]
MYPPSYKLYESRPLPPLPPGATPSPSASPPPRVTPSHFQVCYSPPTRADSPSSSHPRPRTGAFSPLPTTPTPLPLAIHAEPIHPAFSLFLLPSKTRVETTLEPQSPAGPTARIRRRRYGSPSECPVRQHT